MRRANACRYNILIMRMLAYLLTPLLFACAAEPRAAAPRERPAAEYTTAAGREPTTRSGPATCLAALSVSDATDPLPLRLSETGCFTRLGDWQPVAHVTWYDVQSPLYTDGAGKERFLSLPENERLEYVEDRLRLPPGTSLIKVFALQMASGETQPVEVRFVFRGDGLWRFFTYRWDDERQDAFLLTERERTDFQVRDAGGSHLLRYTFPSPADCPQCHSDATDIALGVRVEQWNGPRVYPSGTATQSAKLEAAGYLAPLPEGVEAQVWPDPADPQAPLEARARSYLTSNCSHCHRPGGFSSPGLSLDLRYDKSLADTHLCDAAQFHAPRGTQRVVAGSPEQSWILNRMTRMDDFRMSPWRSAPDAFGVALIDEWIRGLQSCP